MTITDKPSKINLFFCNEKSYIDGSSLATSITPVAVSKSNRMTDGKMYNLAGQQVDGSYKGIIIQNGKKFVNK